MPVFAKIKVKQLIIVYDISVSIYLWMKLKLLQSNNSAGSYTYAVSPIRSIFNNN